MGTPTWPICSYFAMFPPQIAYVFIQWLTQPGDVVYDPFLDEERSRLKQYFRTGLV